MGPMNTDAARFQPWQQLLRSGRHYSLAGQWVEFSAADIRAAAAAYDPAVYPAPLVVGHPRTDSPAYGRIAKCTAVDVSGGTALEGLSEQVDTAFAAAVVEGRYPQRSASLFPPDHPRNPVPGVWYLRHLG